MCENIKAIRRVKKILQDDVLQTKHEYEHDKYISQLCSMNECKVDYFARLSDEILLNVFKWLPRPHVLKYALVCKRWSHLMEDAYLWKYYDFASKKISVEHVIKVMNKGVQVLALGRSEVRVSLKRRVHMNSMTSLDAQIDFHLNPLIKLEIVDFTACSLATSALNLILKRTKYLKKISLEGLLLDVESLFFLSQNKNVDTLNLSTCEGITHDGLVCIMNNLRNLVSLNVAWTHMSRDSIELVCSNLPFTLEKLNISGNREHMFDSDVQNLCQSCPNLLELDLSDTHNITSTSIELIANHLSKLVYIGLSRCYSILPSAYLMLDRIETLYALDAYNILKEKSIRCLKKEMKQLKDVNRYPFSSIARPTCGFRRSSLWGYKVKDEYINHRRN